jgi:Phosphodiester glycosidase
VVNLPIMTPTGPGAPHRPRRRTGVAVASVVLGLLTSAGVDGARAATPAPPGLPLGDPDLKETRTTEAVADGVTLTRIVRGEGPAPADRLATTTRGPWLVDVLTVDTRKATAHLRAAYGPDLARVETGPVLARGVNALAGVNASFFTIASGRYPGDLAGLGVFGGKVLSEPSAHPGEVDLVVNAATNNVTISRMSWVGTLTNRKTGAGLRLTSINHPPSVPAGCGDGDGDDPAACTAPGDLVALTPEFSTTTPSGPGREVVIDAHGCVLTSTPTRGTTLTVGQTSLQATGQKATALANLARGCLLRTDSLRTERGTRLTLKPSTFAVSGRYRLTSKGEVVAPDGTGTIFGRNPRTIAGTTGDGRIVLATVDGRRTTSVGATLAEAAAVARSLGLRDSLNLDGGGSTTMVVKGTVVNQPSGALRAVGDALVVVGGRWTPPTAAARKAPAPKAPVAKGQKAPARS